MNNQPESFGFGGNNPNMTNPIWNNNWNQNQAIRNLENRVTRIEREVQRLNNRVTRIEQNTPWPRINSTNSNYQPDSYNMM